MTEVLMTATNPTEGQAAPKPAETLVTQQQASPAKEPQQQATEAPKPAETAQKPSDDASVAKLATPEKYDFKAHEGYEFDPSVISAYSEVAKELNLSQEAAQKVLDKMAPALQARQSEQIEAIKNEWADLARGDKEFGGDKLNENLGIARKALDQFGSPELRTLLNESGLGNHPEVVRFFFRAGRAISEDRFVGGTPAAGKGAGGKSFSDLASALYSNQP